MAHCSYTRGLVAAAAWLALRRIGAEEGADGGGSDANVLGGANGTCADAKISECEGLNKTCYEEACDRCLETHIPHFSDEEECVAIAELRLEDFEAEHGDEIYYSENRTDAERLELLVEASEFVSRHNANQNPRPEFVLGINPLSALTADEYNLRNGYRFSQEIADRIPEWDPETEGRRLAEGLPGSVDWEEAGATTSVKNQASCGCCWACSTAAAMEGITAIDTNFTYRASLSFQQLVSCDTTSMGCDGGYPGSALEYAFSRGMETYEDYPFVDQSGSTTKQCDYNEEDIAVEVGAERTVLTTNNGLSASQRVEQMKQAVARQPVTMALNANCQTFQHYRGGVATTDGKCACDSSSSLDHAVLMVGYNDDPDDGSSPYWKIKNSWGTGWGEGGYMRVSQEASTSFGLFGCLAEGYIPLSGTNDTSAPPGAASTLLKSRACSLFTAAAGSFVALVAL